MGLDVIHCGAQHHFIGRCEFHLASLVNGYVVSTVGEYFDSAGRRTTVSGDSFYETMVFRAVPATVEDDCDLLVHDWEELWVRRCDLPREANEIHAEAVEYFAVRRPFGGDRDGS